MKRRDLLTAAGLSVVGALAGCGLPAPPVRPAAVTARASTAPTAPATTRPARAAVPAWHQGRLTGLHRVRPWKTVIAEVPDANPRTVGLTIDDGVSSDTVAAYIDLATRTGLRLTFFVNGVYDSWTRHRAALLPLVESGQIQLGNHTWDHPDITTLSDARIMDEVLRNEKFLTSTFGIDPKPYFRPPYFATNDRTNKLLVGEGYSVITWWTGTFGDSVPLTPPQILANATKYLTANTIVIGHANHPPVISVFDQITELLRRRNLRTVTLADVFATS